MSNLLSYHKSILREICDPQNSELVILARGLGLRRIVSTLLGILDDERNLVILVCPNGDDGDDEVGELGEEMRLNKYNNHNHIEGKGLRVLGYETPAKERKEIYKMGGVVCVSSRILVVDMLQGDLEREVVCGLIILKAERITPLVIEAFIVRLFREKNKKGFVKAFSDQPELIGSGRGGGGEMSPLKMVMKELMVRNVLIYPRFHETINKSLERRKADVVELSQPLTKNMQDIQFAIIQCMTVTLSEVKKSNTNLDLDDLNIENAYFRSFDSIVRNRLSSVWHKVGPRTKQLVNDLKVLRSLLFYLLSYDAISFNAYLETIISSNDISNITGNQKQHQSPWLLTESAEVMINCARRRCFVFNGSSSTRQQEEEEEEKRRRREEEEEEEEEEEGWAVLDELESRKERKGKGREETTTITETTTTSKFKEKKPSWLPTNLLPILEELPKWNLLNEILEEIEYESVHLQSQSRSQHSSSSNDSYKVLIMTSSTRSCELIREYLDCRGVSGSGSGGIQGVGEGEGEEERNGRKMMMKKLKEYLGWRGRLRVSQTQTQTQTRNRQNQNRNQNRSNANSRSGVGTSARGGGQGQGVNPNPNPNVNVNVNEALKKKDREKAERSGSRRRVRGGGPISNVASGSGSGRGGESGNGNTNVNDEMDIDMESMLLWTTENPTTISSSTTTNQSDSTTTTIETQYEQYYGLISQEELIAVRAYSDDSDDRMLEDLKPRFIVMFEPCVEFVRRVEVYKSSNPGFSVRVYHMVYSDSSEEHRYLAGIRKEKEAFERLVHERQTMVITLDEPGTGSTTDSMIKTISTRLAGGRRELSKEPSRVVVDMREFRSTLLSLIHASSMMLVPVTLTVGDYILTPEICVERKSLPDLVSSFNSGRLYTQCEMMSMYYKHPVLLIEFEEDKAFSMNIISDIKSYVKQPPSNKSSSSRQNVQGQAQAYGAQTYKDTLTSSPSSSYQISIQQKLVLLTLHFTQLRVIWSSSPYFTAEVFKELKLNQEEPDPILAMKIGCVEGEFGSGSGVGVGVGVRNNAAEEVLRCIPGVGVNTTSGTTTRGGGGGGGGGGNVSKVMNQVGSVKELCRMKRDEVELLLGKEDGKRCWEFLHFGEKGVLGQGGK